MPKVRQNDLAPLPATEKAAATHAPFEAGDCRLCHQRADPASPGPLTGPVNELCLSCHDDFQKIVAGKTGHAAARESCVSCHNPHDSRQPKLLVDESATLCLSCHETIKNFALHSPVKHAALTDGAKCLNCHNPHGSEVEKLLVQLPLNLCLTCHGKDDVTDHDGRKLTNMKKLLAENPVHHGPIASEDCSACHNPHGFQNFRLLNQEYPSTFYSAFDLRFYALCFECHETSMITEARTATQTRFRDGQTNLHFLHVNKAERGRTCRACHEVHASKQKHQLRDSVPYGPKGWALQLNYTKTPTGGSCAKTCHATRSYDRARLPEEKK
ncbi:MAG: cytochrome c3 family protein [Opitutae bacterium]|nr:cytochrome c3 family protein [Opitutae bacterium]